MDNQSISLTEFRSKITPDILRVFKIIQIAMLIGATGFVCITLMLSYLSKPVEHGEILTIKILTGVTLFFLADAVFVDKFIFKSILKKQNVNNINNKNSNLSGADIILQSIRIALLVRNALFLTASFLGCIVIIVAAQQGLLVDDNNLWIWINLLPYLLFVKFIFDNYPTQDYLVHIFEKYILNKIT